MLLTVNITFNIPLHVYQFPMLFAPVCLYGYYHVCKILMASSYHPYYSFCAILFSQKENTQAIYSNRLLSTLILSPTLCSCSIVHALKVYFVLKYLKIRKQKREKPVYYAPVKCIRTFWIFSPESFRVLVYVSFSLKDVP